MVCVCVCVCVCVRAILTFETADPFLQNLVSVLRTCNKIHSRSF